MKLMSEGIQSAWAAWGALFVGLMFLSACFWTVYEWFHEPSWHKGRDAVSQGLMVFLMLYYWHSGLKRIRQIKHQPNQKEDNAISDNT